NADDSEQASALYNEAQEILLQDLPVIPTWYQNAVGGYSNNVDNVEFMWNSQPAYFQITKK
ncbi:MAG: ABC transporter substrate-binding protein, partial [Corynebacterium sp.]|nr:ABC transporter substrate-binding protein [Corynebacterium sp.]